MPTPEAHGPNPWINIGLIVVLFIVMYFLIIRPQMKRQKEQKQMVESLQKGDELITIGGLAGKIVLIQDNFITLAVADSIHVHIQKSAVASVLPKGTLKIDE